MLVCAWREVSGKMYCYHSRHHEHKMISLVKYMTILIKSTLENEGSTCDLLTDFIDGEFALVYI